MCMCQFRISTADILGGHDAGERELNAPDSKYPLKRLYSPLILKTPTTVRVRSL